MIQYYPLFINGEFKDSTNKQNIINPSVGEIIANVSVADEKDADSLANLEDGEDDFFYMVRPYCNKFLNELSKYYEIVIYTAAMQDYADWIIMGIDSKEVIKHRLYR